MKIEFRTQKEILKDIEFFMISSKIVFVLLILSFIGLLICSYPTIFNILYPIFLTNSLIGGIFFLWFQIKLHYFGLVWRLNGRRK